MSSAYGQVRFSDGTVYYTKYVGFYDLMCPELNEYSDGSWRDWDNEDCLKEPDCTSSCSIETVEVATDYGGGGTWKGFACKEHASLLSKEPPKDSWTESVPQWWDDEWSSGWVKKEV